ncbi:protein Dok-7-like isoform X2 [Hypomesus transpacificus]|uniref:protein Dok-7-like isoform X2 n=1 Tax=Hypomesus transpacificus TaxID=137520 RepID=UPI001F084EA0|nr:protein Dok-7-like isoform X2 [Hypomesus transpacificus]
MTDSVVVEGYVKFRDGKKWKTRWVVLRKPSPVADCLVLLVFKDKSEKTQGHKERASITLEDICGLETGLWYEGAGYTLAILCLSQAAVLGFDSKDALLAWDIRVRYSLGEVHKFGVGVLTGTKLESGPATLHLCNNLLVLARDIPPTIIGQWNLPDLRRYGPVSNGFVFEGGTRCGYWAGVFFLSTTEGEHISFLFDCIVRGISPTRGPFGLRPVLPDPNASQNYSEERVNHEAQELEKRLSMLSHQSSTASSTYGPSVAGDDRSISGSSDTSDTSQSDCSIGSRLAIWTEPAIGPSSSESAGQSGAKVATQSEEKLSVSQVGEARPMAKPSRSRQLQEIGRQSSSDSGIATGSHSSYSGSFSSYTGSLDNGPGEDFESLLSLPPHIALDLSPCSCPPAPGHEYQVPTSLRYLYDTPKSLLQEGAGGARAPEPPVSLKDEATEGEEAPGSQSSSAPGHSAAKFSQGQLEENKSKVAPSGDSQHPESCQICSSHTAGSKTILIICSTCGGFKGTPLSHLGGSAVPSIPGSSEPNSAEESMNKCPCRRNSSAESKTLVSTEAMASNASPAQLTNHSTVKLISKKINEEQAPNKKGKERLANLLADLLGYPSIAGEAGTQTGRLNFYESMAAASGHVLRSQPPLPHGSPSHDLSCGTDKDSIIYENCFKCKRENCHPPQRVPPPMPYCSTNSATLVVGQKNHFGQALPFKPCLEMGVSEQEGMSKQEDSAQVKQVDHVVQNRVLQSEELNCQSVTDEDKKTRSKEERRKVDPAYEIMESRALEKNTETEEKSKYELMGSCGHQRFLHETEGAVFVFPTDMTAPDRCRGDGVNYVNIPVSPTSKKQLNYMELELQEPAVGGRAPASHLSTQRKSSTKYAQIDITATETAHKVGTQHALGREEGLHSMEQRRRGAPQ